MTIPSGTWTIDPTHSSIELTVKHFGFGTARPTMRIERAAATVGDDATTSTLTGSAATATFDSGNDKRDQHVRSDDFLDADNNPMIDFASTSISESGGVYSVAGNLTLGTTSTPATFTVDSLDVAGDQATFVATTALDRRALNVNKMPGFIIGNTVAIRVSGTATRS
ncbi:MAG: YceI family protein [Actinomycetota bacterium]